MKPLVVALVRVQGLVILLYGAVSATYLPAYLRDFRVTLPNPDAHEGAHIALVASLLRLALYLAGGLVLFTRAGAIVTRLSAEPPSEPSPDTTAGPAGGPEHHLPE
jgi:hypothetical protein